MKQLRRTRLFPLSNSLKRLGRSIARRKVSSIALDVMMHDKISKEVIQQVGKVMAKELKSVCTLNPMSILRNKGPEALKTFSWSTLVEELKKRAPSKFPYWKLASNENIVMELQKGISPS